MKLSHFFIDRPRFATVLSVLIMIFGILGYMSLPVSQYPEITPPQIQVIASYPGANAETIASTVATPLEQEINGIEGMIYISSQSTNDGVMTISITFEPGTDLDTAQVMVQNRVAAAESRLPEAVRRLGINTIKNSPDMLMVINLFSPDDTYDQKFISNYAILNINDKLKRISGVGNTMVFGGSEYSMRIWLDPDRLFNLNLTVEDIIAAIKSQNIQVAGGILNQSPSTKQDAFELSVQTQGRLKTEEEFAEIIVKSGENGELVRLKDVAKIELDVQSYTTRGYQDGKVSVAIPIFLRPGANALDTAHQSIEEITKLSEFFPKGLEHSIIYNPTKYVEKSISEVFTTLFEAMILVIIVIIVFLQSWRTAIIPVIAIPISLIGTFGLMHMFGYSLNMLSLFGLVLAIGIVVDDAIVVVENVERKLREGLDIVPAVKQTMDEVGSALIAMGLVLVFVFLPTVLMDGITGQFYKQFGITIASATMISVIVSLTLSPAMAAIFMKHVEHDESESIFAKPAIMFNNFIDRISVKYSLIIKKLIRSTLMVSVVYVGLISLTGLQFSNIPVGFIPAQDKGYTITVINLPAGASLDRTDEVVKRVSKELAEIEGVSNTVAFTGYNGATGTNSSNAGAVFSVLEPINERRPLNEIIDQMRMKLFQIDSAFVMSFPPPAVEGMGNAGGFRMIVQDKAGKGLQALEQAAWALAMAANASEEITSSYTVFETKTPRIYLDIDRDRARQLNVPLENVFNALGVNLGSSYINDFNFLGRTFRVTAQADAQHRMNEDDVLKLRVRNTNGKMVPIGSIATIANTSGPSRVLRYNLYQSAGVNGDTALGFSSGEALDKMEQLAEQVLPEGFTYEWTDLAYQEKSTGNTAIYIFCLVVLFVFLLLSAQYESWTLPLAIILIVPMCLLSAGIGLIVSGTDNNILTQIGLIVLIGLASKNAILIVEFAKQNEDQGMDMFKAATEAARLRLRPILMTALSFILGVIPLVIAAGPGFEMRRAIGTTVFSGMIGVTIFGLIFTPVFYIICRKIALFNIKK